MTKELKYIVGNWKMFGLREETSHLASAIVEGALSLPDDVQMILCPPFTQIERVRGIVDSAGLSSTIKIGGQNCHTNISGAFTGDISAEMLADIGAQYVILGHSERRQAHGETDIMIRRKIRTAKSAGLTPIVCFGETLKERQEGRAATVLASQIDGSLTENFNGIIAYEPVWAIGTGITPTYTELSRTLFLLKGLLQSRLNIDDIRMPILYGGSVTPSQAPEIFQQDLSVEYLLEVPAWMRKAFYALQNVLPSKFHRKLLRRLNRS
ncbi:triose-phosphate isomerase [Swingsia samuiensis]|uniref:triose-phosphate isomerase n=1 Tax=Swingsia samuiensis TaxID=1293412 RepID=UPI001FE476C9|nr:triose-phosphate isomerase [Swingsia samuiensis]